MYSDYLHKVAVKKHIALPNTEVPNDMDVDNQTDDQRQQTLREYEMEETNEEKNNSMKTGEKYIIRKLISFKINIPKIDDYIQKVSSLEINKGDRCSTNVQNKLINENFATMSFGASTSNTSTNNDGSNYNLNQFSLNQDNSSNKQSFSNTAVNPFKTFQGFNDDSQIAYYYQNMLFQNPLPNSVPFYSYGDQLISGMQNLNLNTHCNCEDSYQNQTNSNSMQNNMNQFGMMPSIQQQNNQFMNHMSFCYPNMQNYSFQNGFPKNFQETSLQNSTGYMQQNCFNPQATNSNQMEGITTEEEEEKVIVAKMRLPAHVKKSHIRSNSVTPADYSTGSYPESPDLSGLQSPKVGLKQALKLEKYSSEVKSLGHNSMRSIPALQNLSDLGSSLASNSSVFDGNDSEIASAIDIELDENGQPVFDGESSLQCKDNSEEIPVKNKNKTRPAVNKKSAFCRGRQDSISSDESDSNEE